MYKISKASPNKTNILQTIIIANSYNPFSEACESQVAEVHKVINLWIIVK